jgi:hypothetical protein
MKMAVGPRDVYAYICLLLIVLCKIGESAHHFFRDFN